MANNMYFYIEPSNTVCTRPSEKHPDHGGESHRVFKQFLWLKLVPLKWRYLVSPTSRYPGKVCRGRPPAVGLP
jgi:hypothetical protein